MKKEYASYKKMWIAIGFQTFLAWVLAALVFILGSFIKGVFL